MSENNFIKNITSKNINLSKQTILNMIKTASVDNFSELCEKCDFIFPFLKERIIKDFVKLVNKEDLKTVFEFSKIYCCDFEDIIINSWLKFADENLTDEILELFENGTNEQKTYCASYFKHIKDTLALEALNKNSYSDFEPLKINCAATLSEFNDTEVYNNMKQIALNSSDDFEKTSAFLFLSAYRGDDAVSFVVDNCLNSPFKAQIISNVLDFNDFRSLENLEKDKIIQIFSILIDSYPEDLSLDTIGLYGILDFAKLIGKYNNQYAKNCLILAREKFAEFYENDIYSFDLDKQTKEELKEIYNFLKGLNLDTEELNDELKKYNSNNFEAALDVIRILNLKNFAPALKECFQFLNEEYIAKTAVVLKEIGCSDYIPSLVLNNIQNENIKALVQSCLK